MSADAGFMDEALTLAREAGARGEVPVGALIVDASGAVIARAANAPVGTHDPSAHAEMLVIRQAALAVGNYRLPEGATLYVTLEPCAMCAGAISHARVARLVYGASDPKGGAVENGARFFEQPTCHWRPQVTGGVGADECATVLRDFFRARRS